MSDPVIRLENVSKMFRIHKNPRTRILDSLGFKVDPSRYNEFWALRNINLTVKSGRKIGIVGSNGAGKSTLLKIIAGQLKASGGQISIHGKIHALMELGTGFHPEFSGWENIISSLTYMGVTGQHARQLAESIVEFTELSEFIHNPLKTYSSGMYARLAFSVSTAISPEILIIDEILGAGDAYFSHKAFERMKDLTAGGTTVLFVSHDMSAVEQLCDDAVWIERGKIIQRGDVSTISKAYAHAVRKREELRLNARNSLMKISTLEKIRNSNKPIQLIIRILYKTNPICVKKVSLLNNDEIMCSVSIGDAQDTSIESNAFILLDNSVSNWGPPVKDTEDSWYREISPDSNNSGAVVFNLDGFDPSSNFNIQLTSKGGEAEVQCFDGHIYETIGKLVGTKEWTDSQVKIPREILEKYLVSLGLLDKSDPEIKKDVTKTKEVSVSSINKKYEIYTGHAEFLDVTISGPDGKSRSIFYSFDTFVITMKIKVLRDLYQPEFVASFYRSGVTALQDLSRQSQNQPDYLAAGTTATVTLTIPSLPLGRGKYLLSLGIFPPVPRNSLDTEKLAYLLQDRRYEILVEQPEGGLIDLGISRGKCIWEIT